MPNLDFAGIISSVCESLTQNNHDRAANIIQSSYPFIPIQSTSRNYTYRDITNIFLRDGCIDRYSGQRLVFPPVLRIISLSLPNTFPYHKNWKMSECHIAYWELIPTIDHVIPVARGGRDDESNWVTTSQLRNSAKSNWTLEEIGWDLVPAGKLADWDGLVKWFIQYAHLKPDILQQNWIRQWYQACIPFQAMLLELE